MLTSFICSVSLIIQLSRAAGNPTWDVLNNRKALEDAFSIQKARKYRISYFDSWFGIVLFVLGLIAWFTERAIWF